MTNNGFDFASQKGLVNELIQGRDLTKQLYSILLKESPAFTSYDEAPFLNVAQKILAKIESSLTILRYEACGDQLQNTTVGTTDSHHLSFNGSPKTPDSESDLKDPIDCKDVSRKRKVISRCTILRVKGCCKSGFEGPVEDGLNWRKYGQKDIHGAKYPRGYYRCTQRGQGCYATKQVQRSDDDPTYFEVTYRGKHTCYQVSSSSPSIPKPNPLPKLEPIDAPSIPKPLEILWSFEAAEAKSPLLAPQFSSKHSSSTQHYSQSTTNTTTTTTTNNNNNNNNNFLECDATLFSPRNMSNNFNVFDQHTTNQQGVSPLAVNSMEFSFDGGEFDHELHF